MLTAAVLTSCNSNLTEELGDTPQLGPDGEMPISFAAYTSRGTTRAGATGTLDNFGLKGTTISLPVGFGVFGYYTNAEDYASGALPDFMYNQQVKWDAASSVFDYSPVRYWPNEYGSKAQSEDIDKVSFFAYAPYVKVNPSTGYLADAGEGNEAATWGITGTTRNTYTGDPLVKYIASFDMDKSVDLCWGVYNEWTSGWSTMNGKQTITYGLPWLNVQHARSVDQKLMFTFRHATARLNVQVDANVDDGGSTPLGTHYGTSATDNATKVYVRSISFTGMAAQGALNLNNVKPNEPLWMNYSGTGWIENGQSVTVYDGLRDGYEGTAQAVANNETMTGLNPLVISNEGNTSPGVTHTAVNLFGRSGGTPGLSDGVFVIPTGEKVRMNIVYDVETDVANLPDYLSDGVTHGISVENRITKDLMAGGSNLIFEGGKSYTLKLHLGLNSVKFTVAVSEDWDDDQTVVPTPVPTPPAGTLTAGKFSVATDKQVYFSQGNLQATTTDYGAHWTWKFADHQWDYIGDAAGNNSINGNGTLSTANGTVDLFGWVGASNTTWTGAAIYGITNSITLDSTEGYGNDANEALKSDWGKVMGTGWRTLTGGTGGEWNYILSTRSSGATVNGTSNARYTHATINTDGTSVNGLIIFPDNCSIDNTSATSWGTINGNSAYDTKCTIAQWKHLEELGCVFLPAACYREVSTVYDELGGYWSSSPLASDVNNAYFVLFGSDFLDPAYGYYRALGFSVRLVRDVE